MGGLPRVIEAPAVRVAEIAKDAARAVARASACAAPAAVVRRDADSIATTPARATDLASARARLQPRVVADARAHDVELGGHVAVSGARVAVPGARVAIPSAHVASRGARVVRSGVPSPIDGDDGTVMRHRFAGTGTLLATTPQAAYAIARGEHQIDVVAGTHIDYPSQDLRAIESADPHEPGQTHVISRHVGSDLDANVARLRREPHIRAAGGFLDEGAAQYATDATIANPVNQQFLADFLADASRSKDVLYRVDLGRVVGTSTLRRDLLAGHPTLVPSATADVVVVKDASFPEGYRVLTSYPEATRGAEVDATGRHL